MEPLSDLQIQILQCIEIEPQSPGRIRHLTGCDRTKLTEELRTMRQQHLCELYQAGEHQLVKITDTGNYRLERQRPNFPGFGPESTPAGPMVVDIPAPKRKSEKWWAKHGVWMLPVSIALTVASLLLIAILNPYQFGIIIITWGMVIAVVAVFAFLLIRVHVDKVPYRRHLWWKGCAWGWLVLAWIAAGYEYDREWHSWRYEHGYPNVSDVPPPEMQMAAVWIGWIVFYGFGLIAELIEAVKRHSNDVDVK